MGGAPFPEPTVLEEKPEPPKVKLQKRLTYWILILIGVITALVVIWLLFIMMYPSIELG